MSNYNVGDMIRLTRQAIGMSQEELSDNICSVQTLSRIENGKVKVKKRIYQQLMERMGRDGAKNYSVLSAENLEILDIMVEVDNAIFYKDYSLAELKLNRLKEGLSVEEEINYLYIRECEILIDSGLHRMSKEKELEELEKLSTLIVPDYKQYLGKVYPFMRTEVVLLMNIGSVYGALGQRKMAIDIYYMLIRSMNTGYMRQEDSIQLIVMLISNAARYYGGLGKRDTAIRMSWNAIHKAKRHQLYTVLPKCYGEIAWNMMKQIEAGERDAADEELCRQYLRQSYATAVLSHQKWQAEASEKTYSYFWGEDIYCLSGSPKNESSGSSLHN